MSRESALSRLCLLLLAFGIAGTAAELLLLGHTEDWQQWIPIALFAVGFPLALMLVWERRPRVVSLFRGAMWLYVASGLVGTWLHYRGNVEFELEMTPEATGLPLVWEALTGATPALAPGTMVWFGLLGLIAVWRDLARSSDEPPTEG